MPKLASGSKIFLFQTFSADTHPELLLCESSSATYTLWFLTGVSSRPALPGRGYHPALYRHEILTSS